MEVARVPGTRRKPGWMGPHFDGLRSWLLERGYTPGSIKHVRTLAGAVGAMDGE